MKEEKWQWSGDDYCGLWKRNMETEAQAAEKALRNIRKRNSDEEQGEETRKETVYGLGGAYMDHANGNGAGLLQHHHLPPGIYVLSMFGSTRIY